MMVRMMAGGLALLALSTVLSCAPSSSRARVNFSTAESTQVTDRNLLALAAKFAAGVENEPIVFQEIGLYPRKEIIERLTKLQEESREDTSKTITTTFLLCNLEYDVANNKKALVASFEKDLHSRDPYADWEMELLCRLVKKGHYDLLPVLFNASKWSDGAMSQSLSFFFIDRLREAPQDFIMQLSSEPKSVRQRVYTLLAYGEISPQDVNRLVSYVNSLSDSNLELTGREVIAALHPSQK